MHILLVEDVQDTRHLFSMAFVLAGHRTTSASSGSEAIELALKHRFDVVLLDIEMPNVNGWKVLEVIREIPGNQQLPIVMISAHHDADKERRAKEAGAYALLRKPILPQQVIEILEGAV
jgi:CheY-like chemotaxis protein